MTTFEQRSIKIGDRVEFKSDVEQVGYVKEIRGAFVVLEGNFHGDYIGGQTETTQSINRVYLSN